MPSGRPLQPKLIGFHSVTDTPAMEVRLPVKAFPFIRMIARVLHTDPKIRGSYPVTGQQAEAIAAIAQMSIDTHRFVYFVESD